jgi:hypothetical protein
VPNRAWRFESSLPHLEAVRCTAALRSLRRWTCANRDSAQGASRSVFRCHCRRCVTGLRGVSPPTRDRAIQLPRRRCDSCGLVLHQFERLTPEYVYLLGLYLGDGSIAAHPRSVYRLRISLHTRYPGIIASAAAAIETVRAARAAVQRCNGNYVEVYSYWKAWPCLLPQHAPGKKQDRKIELTDWQRRVVNRWPEQLVGGLVHSDGCRFQNTGRCNWVHPRYSFRQVSDDIRRIFCDTCDLVGLHWTPSGKHTIYVSRKADVAKLDEFIGPKA